MNIENELNLAKEYYHSGKLSDSEKALKNILKTDQTIAEAWFYLGLIAYDIKKYDASVALIDKAIDIQPEERFFRQQGIALYNLKDYDSLKRCYENLLKFKPDSAEGYNSLGVAYFKKGEPEKAISYHKKALELTPDLAAAYCNIAVALKYQNKIEEAIEYNFKALELNPNLVDAYYNLGIAYKDSNKIDEAIKYYKKALELNPDYINSYLNLGIAYLLNKNFEEGWKYYERRYDGLEEPAPKLSSPKPKWDGESLKGKTIYVIKEQGLGDTIQFVRFLPMLKQFEPDKIIFKTQKSLETILKFSNIFPEIDIVSESLPEKYVDFDVYIALLSLPYYLKINEQNISFQDGYLKADLEKVLSYKHKFFNNDKFKVGIFWQGSASHKSDSKRSVPLEYFYPIFNLPNIQIYSLQKGFGEEQLENLPEEYNIINLGQTFKDFSDTAAAIENLDLVITIDTAIAHLAGALSKKVWIVLPEEPEWRWFMDEDSTAWYKSARLFRPELYKDRRKIFDKISQKLANILSCKTQEGLKS